VLAQTISYDSLLIDIMNRVLLSGDTGAISEEQYVAYELAENYAVNLAIVHEAANIRRDHITRAIVETFTALRDRNASVEE
jgi:hypothetical protein